MSDYDPHAHPVIGPVLRLRLRDGNGEPWNVTLETRSGKLGGRHAEKMSDIGLNQLLGTLHKAHHYTTDVSALWFWAFFQDLLGLTMALWALSGLVMWWQMKPTRIVGAVAVLVALVAVALVMSGTITGLMFGEVPFKLSP